MKEQLITFETAKLAKEKGFKKESFNYYNEKGELLYDNEFNSFGSFQGTKLDNYIDAPTQSLFQKWLREVHNIYVDIWCNASGWGFNLNKTCGTTIYDFHYIEDTPTGMFKTYEEALEKGLQEALLLIR